MALLRLLQAWRDSQHPSLIISVLTVDHGLRIASAAEAITVANWCAALGLYHHTLNWHGGKPKTGLQAKARVARYDLMADWCLAHDVGILLTGHTADDQAETVLMRSARTSSHRSLAGIWPESEWKGVRVLRPLLEFGKVALRDHLVALGQNWIEDPSNRDARFERVRVRQKLVGQDISELQHQAAFSLRETLALRAKSESWMAAHGHCDQWGCLWLPRPAFLAVDAEIAQTILRHSIQIVGGSATVPPAALLAVQNWIVGRFHGRRSLGGVLIMLRRDHVLLAREPGRINNAPMAIPVAGHLLWDARFHVTAPSGSLVASGLVFEGGTRLKNVPLTVQQAMPVVKLAGGECILAQNISEKGVSAMFCERKPT